MSNHKFQRALMHLRKSRADLEAEARGEGETLSKHKKALLKHAREHNINVVKIREELESGESLAHRPDMLQTLDEVEQGLYDCVLCMDIDRLGRGDMQDQGLILSTFKKSKTKIVTPRKTYDLDDEFDEDFTEFETFMARRELKYINRRMQRGRLASVEDGNYIATRPPYGYTIKHLENGRALEPNPEQAQVVKMIFEWYTNDGLGSGRIANKLNILGYKTYTGIDWKASSVLTIIKNAVYAGRIQWKKKEQVKSTVPGKRRDTKTRPKEEWIDVQGKHEPLISMETYQKAQYILGRKYHVPYQLESGITNPLAGLIKCGHCGSSMVRRPYTKQAAHLKCYNQLCDSKSTRFSFVEERLLKALHEWLQQYKNEWENYKPGEQAFSNEGDLQFKKSVVQRLENELQQLHTQKGKLHDFLERGIYDEDTYLERSNHLAERINEAERALMSAESELKIEKQRKNAQADIIPQVEHVLDSYHSSEDAAQKNALLKSILDHAVYRKDKTQKGDDFNLELYTKLIQITT